MLQDVIISMKTVQNCDEEENSSTLDFMTDGLYSFIDNVGCLSYEETEVTGMPGTRTSVIIMPDRIVVDRDGSITSRMEFKEGEKSSFIYKTPFGNATMGINTRHIKHSFDENGGNAEIEYVLDMQHTVFSKNKFTINVVQPGGNLYA